MTNEELSKLDFQLATLKMLESNTAMLRTILQNQIEIMTALNFGKHKDLEVFINNRFQENLAIVNEDLKNQIPESEYLKFKKDNIN